MTQFLHFISNNCEILSKLCFIKRSIGKTIFSKKISEIKDEKQRK